MVKQEIINEIAQLLDSKEVVYLHRDTHEVLSHPDPDDPTYSHELDYLVQEVTDQIDLSLEKYIEFKPLTSREAFKFMQSFTADVVTDNTLRLRLQDALSGKRPFRFFREALEDHPTWLQYWYDYNQAQLEIIVSDAIDMEMGGETS